MSLHILYCGPCHTAVMQWTTRYLFSFWAFYLRQSPTLQFSLALNLGASFLPLQSMCDCRHVPQHLASFQALFSHHVENSWQKYKWCSRKDAVITVVVATGSDLIHFMCLQRCFETAGWTMPQWGFSECIKSCSQALRLLPCSVTEAFDYNSVERHLSSSCDTEGIVAACIPL